MKLKNFDSKTYRNSWRVDDVLQEHVDDVVDSERQSRLSFPA